MRFSLAIVVSALFVVPANAQSLYLQHGQRAAEVTAGWSVGPSSDGAELAVGVSFDGRTEAGITFGRYTYSFDGGGKSRFTEYAPFVRVFPVKEQNGAPVSLSISGQIFLDDYGTDDTGRYLQIATTVYKQLKLSERCSLQPFAGFGFVAESYAFGGAPAERAQYLTRDFGLHFTTDIERRWIARLTLAEQSFRRETYRGARVGLIRRF